MTGFCINCDNKHGCKSQMPPCIDVMERDGVKGHSGKQYLADKYEVRACEECSFFRSCWSPEEFDQLKKWSKERRNPYKSPASR